MRKIILMVLMLGLVGCATTQKPVALDNHFWENRKPVIGIAKTTAPKPDAFMTGNMGLLDIAINRGNAKSLITHLEKLDTAKVQTMDNEFIAQLQARGFQVKKIDQPIDLQKMQKFSGKSETTQYAEYDFRNLKSNDVDYVLLLAVERVGTIRNYYGFMPTGAPMADFKYKGYLVDLNTNELKWYVDDVSNMPISEPWDQAPSFNNVTAAVNTNLERGIDSLGNSFFGGNLK